MKRGFAGKAWCKALIGMTAVTLLLASCATPVKRSPAGYAEYANVQLAPGITRTDISHVVAPGETLWRIGKMYDVRVDELMRVNNLSSPQALAMGQKLIIPHAAPIRPAVPLYPSTKWRYIVIHHTATGTGDALSIFRMHLRRGFWKGLGYDFVITNGSFGKGDGQIQVSPRWVKQEDGAHCKASGMNHQGIGICLVGNFSREQPSEKQLESLAYLVQALKNYYNIPPSHILGHGQVSGAATECPGKRFPWSRFWQKFNAGR